MAEAERIVLDLQRYLRDGRAGMRACFSCGAIGLPRPVGRGDTSGRERRCGICGLPCAIELDQAAREKWVLVVDGSGRVLNDVSRQALSPVQP